MTINNFVGQFQSSQSSSSIGPDGVAHTTFSGSDGQQTFVSHNGGPGGYISSSSSSNGGPFYQSSYSSSNDGFGGQSFSSNNNGPQVFSSWSGSSPSRVYIVVSNNHIINLSHGGTVSAYSDGQTITIHANGQTLSVNDVQGPYVVTDDNPNDDLLRRRRLNENDISYIHEERNRQRQNAQQMSNNFQENWNRMSANFAANSAIMNANMQRAFGNFPSFAPMAPMMPMAPMAPMTPFGSGSLDLDNDPSTPL